MLFTSSPRSMKPKVFPQVMRAITSNASTRDQLQKDSLLGSFKCEILTVLHPGTQITFLLLPGLYEVFLQSFHHRRYALSHDGLELKRGLETIVAGHGLLDFRVKVSVARCEEVISYFISHPALERIVKGALGTRAVSVLVLVPRRMDAVP